jgi:hypothetical protein
VFFRVKWRYHSSQGILPDKRPLDIRQADLAQGNALDQQSQIVIGLGEDGFTYYEILPADNDSSSCR